MNDELKPCPFCGEVGIDFNYSSSIDGSSYSAYCKVYGCSGMGPPRKTKAEAIAAWNRRVPELESQIAPQWTRTPPTEPGWYCIDDCSGVLVAAFLSEWHIRQTATLKESKRLWLRIPRSKLPKEGTHANPQ